MRGEVQLADEPGAVVNFAVTAEVAGIDLQTVGLILMIVGAIGLVLGLVLMSSQRRRAGRSDAGPYG